jgi:acyl-CoA reductase-like NAD-dependent aldehyde dehydrogenase
MDLKQPVIPAFRFGERYDSLNQSEIRSSDGSRVLAFVGNVNAGIIRRDLRRIGDHFKRLQQIPVERMLEILRDAARLFMDGSLPVSEGVYQTPEDYIRLLSATGGMPHALIRANMHKIADVMLRMDEILSGLTRGLDLDIIEYGMGEQDGRLISYYPATTHLGAVLPSNSPGVNSLWLPATALRIPVVLKPGREDPWTPWRIINALIASGCPAEGFGYYPTDHEGAGVLLSECTRVMVFGGADTVRKHEGNPRISVHGPGYSKVLIGEDAIEQWPDYLDLLAESVAKNGGRSCINASTIVVPRFGKEIADALAQRLAEYAPLPLDAPDARLAGFANADFAAAINAQIEQSLQQPGATLAEGQGERLVELNGQSYLTPTVVYCENPEHPLAKAEFLLPFTSVVEMPQRNMAGWIGPSLVLTAITEDPAFRRELLQSPNIKRLNLGPMPTTTVRWDQPHEGNLFEFLYERRAIQRLEQGGEAHE